MSKPSIQAIHALNQRFATTKKSTTRNPALTAAGITNPYQQSKYRLAADDNRLAYVRTTGRHVNRRFRSRATNFTIALNMPGRRMGFAGSSMIDVTYIRNNPTEDSTVQKAIETIAPSVVQVRGWAEDRSKWSGSGTIVDLADVFPGINFPPDTYGILTNNHVAPPGETKYLTITLANGMSLEAKVLTSPVKKTNVQDGIVDAALLIVQSKMPLPAAKISTEPPKLGDTILTAGHPLGLPKMSFTRGMVSQPAQETGQPVYVIQHDAEINPGNSGGALFNLKGELIGTNTFTFRDSNGLSFAYPTLTQIYVLNEILRTGEYIRGYFGLSVKEFTDFERKMTNFPPYTPGAKVSWVDNGSEAHNLGIRANDIVSKIESTDGSQLDINIDNPFETTRFLQWMHARKPGSKIRMLVYHYKKDGDTISYIPKTVVLSTARLPADREVLKSDTWGFAIQKDRFKRQIITDVDLNSPSFNAKLEANRWMLVGIKAPGLADKPVLVNDLETFKDILIALRDSGAIQLDLYVADIRDPNIKKKITLMRRPDEDLLVINFRKATKKGIETYLSA